MLRVYLHPLSTFARRVRIAPIEKGLAMGIQFVEVDMTAGTHKQQPYLSLNPYGRVRTLEEDDHFVPYESAAILNYLAPAHPMPALAPSDARTRVYLSQPMKLCDLQIALQFGTIILPKPFLPRDRWKAAIMAQAKQEIESHLEILEHALRGKDYVVGNRDSLVEICYNRFIEFFPCMEILPPASHGFLDCANTRSEECTSNQTSSLGLHVQYDQQ